MGKVGGLGLVSPRPWYANLRERLHHIGGYPPGPGNPPARTLWQPLDMRQPAAGGAVIEYPAHACAVASGILWRIGRDLLVKHDV
jgi:hypothetical protein